MSYVTTNIICSEWAASLLSDVFDDRLRLRHPAPVALAKLLDAQCAITNVGYEFVNSTGDVILATGSHLTGAQAVALATAHAHSSVKSGIAEASLARTNSSRIKFVPDSSGAGQTPQQSLTKYVLDKPWSGDWSANDFKILDDLTSLLKDMRSSADVAYWHADTPLCSRSQYNVEKLGTFLEKVDDLLSLGDQLKELCGWGYAIYNLAADAAEAAEAAEVDC